MLISLGGSASKGSMLSWEDDEYTEPSEFASYVNDGELSLIAVDEDVALFRSPKSRTPI